MQPRDPCLPWMHGDGSAPSCFAFTHRFAFEEGSGCGEQKHPSVLSPHQGWSDKAPLELDTFNLGAQDYLELKEIFSQVQAI